MIARISVRNIRRLLWEEGLGETPECGASGGSSAAHGKRSIFLKRLFKAESFGFLFCVSTFIPSSLYIYSFPHAHQVEKSFPQRQLKFFSPSSSLHKKTNKFIKIRQILLKLGKIEE